MTKSIVLRGFIDYHTKMRQANISSSKRWHLIAALLEQPRLAWAMLSGSALYGVMSLMKIPIFPCAWKNVTGLPCPGCGMTRSALALFRGQWQESLRHNAVTWAILLFWLIIAIGLSVPHHYRKAWIRTIGHWEDRSRWGLWFGAILVIYTLTRWCNFL